MSLFMKNFLSYEETKGSFLSELKVHVSEGLQGRRAF